MNSVFIENIQIADTQVNTNKQKKSLEWKATQSSAWYVLSSKTLVFSKHTVYFSSCCFEGSKTNGSKSINSAHTVN